MRAVGEWVPIDVEDLEAGDTRPVELRGRELLVCNADGTFYVIEDLCPHAGIPLDGGRLRGCILECPMHGGLLDVRDGSPVDLPIRDPVRAFPVRQIDRGRIEVQLGV